MVELHEAQYLMDMGFGRDYWRLGGKAVGHPNFPDWDEVFVSTPVSLDPENLILTTASGRVYKIVSFGGKQEEIIAQIKLDIANRGYEAH